MNKDMKKTNFEPRSFAWHESYTRILDSLETHEEKARFALAIIEYGAYGNEPFLEAPLNVVFEAVRPNIDQSVKVRERAKKANESRWSSEEQTSN